jgi:hypothetical protein
VGSAHATPDGLTSITARRWPRPPPRPGIIALGLRPCLQRGDRGGEVLALLPPRQRPSRDAQPRGLLPRVPGAGSESHASAIPVRRQGLTTSPVCDTRQRHQDSPLRVLHGVSLSFMGLPTIPSPKRVTPLAHMPLRRASPCSPRPRRSWSRCLSWRCLGLACMATAILQHK